MRGRQVIVFVLTAGFVHGPVAAAKDSAPLAPTSVWQMDYAPAECRLLRTFGNGSDKVTMQLGRLDVSDVIELTLAAPHVPVTDGDVAATVSTSTVAQVPGMHARGFAPSGGAPGSIRFRPDQDLPGALRSDVAADKPTRLGVKFVRGFAVDLDLGSMKGPLAALDKCMDDLVTGWGLDAAQQRQRKSAPEPVDDPATWIRASDYPAAQNRAGLGGIVVLRLLVGADGAVQNCAVSKAGGDKAFEEATCRSLTARARFRPATGAAGQPIPSVWIKRVDWRPGAPFITRQG